MNKPSKTYAPAQGARPQSSSGPAAARPKGVPLQPKTGHPAAPPVYRPQPAPKVLQIKRAGATPGRGPVAPAPYRPQPGPLQPKFPTAREAAAVPTRKHPAAPPVYRPGQKNGPAAAGSVQRTPARPAIPSKAGAGVTPPPPRHGLRPLATVQAKPAPNQGHRPPAAAGPKPPAGPAPRPAARPPLPASRPAGRAHVVQAKYDVIIEPVLPREAEKDLVIRDMTITDRPAYPEDIKIQGVFHFGKDKERGHTLAWDILKLHHEHKYKNKTVAQVAADLNSDQKRGVTGGVQPTIDSISEGLKKWIEHKHKQEILYWDYSGENTPRGSFFRGMKEQYLSYKDKVDPESLEMKGLYKELMVLAAVDFQKSEGGGVRTARVDRAKRKLGRVFGDDFSGVTLNNWSGQVGELKRYKKQQASRIKKKYEK